MEAVVGNSTSKLVLVKLADNANDKGECWPSYETIARVCECSVKTAQRHISKLEEMGLIEKTLRPGKQGNQSNLYKITIHNKGRQSDAPRGDKMTLPPRQNDATPSDNLTPPPSVKMTPESVTLEPVITEPVIESLSQCVGFSIESLNRFVLHRKRIKKPMDHEAVKLLADKIIGLANQGQNVTELINDSIIAGYPTIYAKNPPATKPALTHAEATTSSKGPAKIEECENARKLREQYGQNKKVAA